MSLSLVKIVLLLTKLKQPKVDIALKSVVFFLVYCIPEYPKSIHSPQCSMKQLFFLFFLFPAVIPIAAASTCRYFLGVNDEDGCYFFVRQTQAKVNVVNLDTVFLSDETIIHAALGFNISVDFGPLRDLKLQTSLNNTEDIIFLLSNLYLCLKWPFCNVLPNIAK